MRAIPLGKRGLAHVRAAEGGRALATLIGLLGDFDLAEEALQEALAVAVERWPAEGLPAKPRAWLVSAGRDRRPGSPLNVPPCPASNFVLGDRRAYSRDDGTPGWEALEEIVGGLEGGSSVSFSSGMA